MSMVGQATLAALLVGAPAMAQSLQGSPPDVPVLSGTYAYTQVQNCVKSSGTFYQVTASATFDPKSGTFKEDGYAASDDPLTLNHVKGHASYSNSGTTLTLGDTIFQVTYGKLEKGIATYLSAIAVVNSCGVQAWLSRQ